MMEIADEDMLYFIQDSAQDFYVPLQPTRTLEYD